MANGVIIPPSLEYEKVSIYEGSNSRVEANRFGNVVTIQIFNVPPSILQNSTSVNIPVRLRPKRRIDAPLGWVYKSSPGSKPLSGQITDSGVFTGVGYYNNSTGIIELVSDSDGTCFGCITYVIGI